MKLWRTLLVAATAFCLTWLYILTFPQQLSWKLVGVFSAITLAVNTFAWLIERIVEEHSDELKREISRQLS